MLFYLRFSFSSSDFFSGLLFQVPSDLHTRISRMRQNCRVGTLRACVPYHWPDVLIDTDINFYTETKGFSLNCVETEVFESNRCLKGQWPGSIIYSLYLSITPCAIALISISEQRSLEDTHPNLLHENTCVPYFITYTHEKVMYQIANEWEFLRQAYRTKHFRSV